jgi:hypothetical protein
MLKMRAPQHHGPDLSVDIPVHERSMEEDLYDLEQELHQKAEALAKAQALAPQKQLSDTEKIEQKAADPSSQEFVRLVEFIKREHKKSTLKKENHHSSFSLKKIIHYDKMKLEVDGNERQKGLQVNKAA